LLVTIAYLIYFRAAVESDAVTRALWPITALIGLSFYFNPVVSAAALLPPAFDFAIHHRREVLTRRAGYAVLGAVVPTIPYFVRVWIQHGSPFALLAEIARIHTGQLATEARGYVSYSHWF